MSLSVCVNLCFCFWFCFSISIIIEPKMNTSLENFDASSLFFFFDERYVPCHTQEGRHVFCKQGMQSSIFGMYATIDCVRRGIVWEWHGITHMYIPTCQPTHFKKMTRQQQYNKTDKCTYLHILCRYALRIHRSVLY